jgi:Mn-dependent DtxR family transcriptional regulator
MMQEPHFTEKQGQYLAFIQAYTVVNGRPPAESDMGRFFRVTPPSVHRMVIELEVRGLIRRIPGQARNIEVSLDASEIPRLQPIKTSTARY